ncbi:phage protein NinX family protein [Rosenbergiella australiborealis]|uniref:phage protein NinX family protein n=1 Tax=Rosenbergiella australiborealis TaxID=1544696 RepID=UPI001F4EE5B6|nr:phage protein NinX family protein [Rosenbergiella australiborealis]
MNYQEMSDFEINCAVAKAIGFEDVMFFEVDSSICNGPVWTIASGWTDYGIPVSKGNRFDPCNSWADAGPIIQDNGINLMASKVVDSGGLKEWEAMSYEGNCHHWGELNPLRAAMIVFLMMKGGE